MNNWVVSGCKTASNEAPSIGVFKAKTEIDAVAEFNSEYPDCYYVFAIPVNLKQLKRLRLEIEEAEKDV